MSLSFRIKKLEEKIARKAARAELKRKYREEKRRVKIENHGPVSPMKREKIEKMAEKQAEQILAACTFAATPTTTTTATPATKAAAETTPLLVRWVNNSGWYLMIYKQIYDFTSILEQNLADTEVTWSF